jgi:hypothetical protein
MAQRLRLLITLCSNRLRHRLPVGACQRAYQCPATRKTQPAAQVRNALFGTGAVNICCDEAARFHLRMGENGASREMLG